MARLKAYHSFWIIGHMLILVANSVLPVCYGSIVFGFRRPMVLLLERAKDIQYASKQRFTTDRIRELAEWFAALGRVLAKLPPEFQDDPDVQKLAPLGEDRDITLVHLLNRHPSVSSQTKDYEFSRATVNEAWAAGLDDVRHSVATLDSIPLTAELGLRMRLYSLPQDLSK